MVGGGMIDFQKSVKIPFSCYDCGTINIRNIYSPLIKCSKCRKDLLMYGKIVYNIDSEEYLNSVFDWRFEINERKGYVIMNENYKCSKCKEISLKFESAGMWD